MADSFVGGVGGKLADQVAVQIYTPAFVFWAAGAALAARGHWSAVEAMLKDPSETRIVIAAIAALLVVAASAAILQRFEPGTIRILEGYHWPAVLKRWRVAQIQARMASQDASWQRLAQRVYAGQASAEENEQFLKLESALHALPAKPVDVMPTRLGNVLRSAERRIDEKYGLDPRVCWWRLWTVVPKEDRDTLEAARDALDIGARSFIWGAAFAIWSVFSWWALAAALLFAAMSYVWMVSAAVQYAEILETAFDMFRLDLYKSLHLDGPIHAADEFALGKKVTEYLWRGGVNFTFATGAPKPATTPSRPGDRRGLLQKLLGRPPQG